MNIDWIEAPVPPDLPIHQVYGFVFNSDGKILVLEDEGRFNLPGGKPETGEAMFETLIRETLEESQMTINSITYLGCQQVQGEAEFAQVNELLGWGKTGDSQITCAIRATAQMDSWGGT